MRGLMLGLLLTVTVAACAPVEQAVDRTARQAAKGVVTEVLATRFPQVPKQLITPFTDCIIDNSSAAEIRVYARSAIAGVDEETVTTVRGVLARPETVRCLGGTPLVTGLG